jgi:hypothetical protein
VISNNILLLTLEDFKQYYYFTDRRFQNNIRLPLTDSQHIGYCFTDRRLQNNITTLHRSKTSNIIITVSPRELQTHIRFQSKTLNNIIIISPSSKTSNNIIIVAPSKTLNTYYCLTAWDPNNIIIVAPLEDLQTIRVSPLEDLKQYSHCFAARSTLSPLLLIHRSKTLNNIIGVSCSL